MPACSFITIPYQRRLTAVRMCNTSDVAIALYSQLRTNTVAAVCYSAFRFARSVRFFWFSTILPVWFPRCCRVPAAAVIVIPPAIPPDGRVVLDYVGGSSVLVLPLGCAYAYRL